MLVKIKENQETDGFLRRNERRIPMKIKKKEEFIGEIEERSGRENMKTNKEKKQTSGSYPRDPVKISEFLKVRDVLRIHLQESSGRCL